ncbi:hypothetical protein [Phytobacter ursingii]
MRIKQPLLFFPWLVVYSAALTFTVTLSTVTERGK